MANPVGFIEYLRLLHTMRRAESIRSRELTVQLEEKARKTLGCFMRKDGPLNGGGSLRQMQDQLACSRSRIEHLTEQIEEAIETFVVLNPHNIVTLGETVCPGDDGSNQRIAFINDLTLRILNKDDGN